MDKLEESVIDKLINILNINKLFINNLIIIANQYDTLFKKS